MGVDKAFLKVGGVPMIERILGALRSVFQNIIIVTNSPQSYGAYDVDVTTDAFDKRGPLTGIYSGLLKSKDEYNFVVACDMPWLSPGLMQYMASLSEGYDIVVPAAGGLFEPLHAVYRRGLAPIIEEQIRLEKRRIQELFGTQRVRYVAEEEIERFDPLRRSFKNLNTPEEYYKEATCAD
jgi:molybdopterin-guanine dinucleotide biosynthesis protein A